MIKNDFDKDTGIVRVLRQGDISQEDFINHITVLGKDYDYLDRLYVLEDARDSFPAYSKNDYISFIGEINELMHRYKKVYVALVVERPQHTALGMLLENSVASIRDYHLATFNTIEGGETWLFSQM